MAKKPAEPTPVAAKSADELIAEHFQIEAHLKVEGAKFDEFCKPFKTRMAEIDSQLMALFNQQGIDKVACDHGTAYKSTLLNTQITAEETAVYKDAKGREAVLDFCLDNWDSIGNEMLQIGATRDAVKRYMEENAGKPPPGIKVSWFSRINYRKS